ncbi:hypothetical protein SEA_MAKAI_80 [Arthrobacter phage Makai]|nr:hypothetical protein SEA_MAKAI_80 [Arthrobacter phage Makai]
MKFTQKTYRRLVRRSEFRIKVIKWCAKHQIGNGAELIRRAKREADLLKNLLAHFERNYVR